MNILFLVVDSLRADALHSAAPGETPFFARLAREATCFRRAHATECWTLPSHTSMFTGLLPSEHGAHFRSMAYVGTAPTLAESLQELGYTCEMATRNSVLDGTVPGVTRGFAHNERVVSPRATGLNPLAVLLALSKPRFRRQLRRTGFIHGDQRTRQGFVADFARATVPADQELLAYLLDRIKQLRAHASPWFLFANLYDVHAPYPPSDRSIFRPWWPLAGARENLAMLQVLPTLSEHRYLRPGFQLSDQHRRQLAGRYRSAVHRVDAMLEAFWLELGAHGVLDDTVVIVTSDHGEAFGEHGLYLHDASVYQTHLHVPLFMHHPARPPETVNDIVSTRDLCPLLCAIARGAGPADTLLDPAARARRPYALAEHAHYPHATHAAPRYRQDLAAVVLPRRKIIARGATTELYDLEHDPHEEHPEPIDGSSVSSILADEQIVGHERARILAWLRRPPADADRQTAPQPAGTMSSGRPLLDARSLAQ